MRFRAPFLLCFAVIVPFLVAAKPAYQMKAVDALVDGIPPAIAATLEPKGYALSGPKGALCQLWLVKQIDLQPGFEPSLSVKYPFRSGQLIGVLNVEKKTRYKDFRGQRVRSGLYTLRYGKQPEDGNHIGTSELADYLVAIPVKFDSSPDAIGIKKKLHERSAKTTRGTHPAIFSLLVAEKSIERPLLEHDEEHALWIFNAMAAGKDADKQIDVPLRLVLVGQTEAE